MKRASNFQRHFSCSPNCAPKHPSSLDVNVWTVYTRCQQSLRVEHVSSYTGQFYKRNCPSAFRPAVFCST